MTNRKLVAGLLTGVAAGAVIALLFSSKKGRETGRKWMKSGKNLKDDLKGKFNEFIDQVQDSFHGVVK